MIELAGDIMKYVLLLTLFLVGCGGGGGGTTPPPAPSVTTAVTVPVALFTEVTDALQFNMPYDITETVTPVAIDINHDGKDDFVIHMWSKPTVIGQTNTNPCVTQLKIFIHQPNDTFVDQTSTHVDGSTDLGGCSRKVRVADINGDGKPDLIYAINHEDGRNQTNAHDMDAQMAALVSVGSKYVVQKFGPLDWYHSIGTMKDSVGNNLVVGYGYTNHATPNAYQFYANGNVSRTAMDVPPISPTSFEFLADGKLGVESNLLLQASNRMNDYGTIEGFEKTNGQWNRITSLNVMPNVGTVNSYGWTGQYSTGDIVQQINGKYVTFAGMSETCKIKLTPTSEPIVLFNVGGAEIPNYTPGMTVRQADLPQYSTFVGVTIKNGQVTRVPINIEPKQTNSWSFTCEDINGDGYDDVVVYPINADGLPYVYLNDKNSGFTYYDKSNFPAIAQLNLSGLASSLLHDFDKNGIPDLIVFPVDQGAGTAKFRYFKGSTYLK